VIDCSIGMKRPRFEYTLIRHSGERVEEGWWTPVSDRLGCLFVVLRKRRQVCELAVEWVAAHGVADARQVPSNLMPPARQDAHAHQTVRPACARRRSQHPR